MVVVILIAVILIQAILIVCIVIYNKQNSQDSSPSDHKKGVEYYVPDDFDSWVHTKIWHLNKETFVVTKCFISEINFTHKCGCMYKNEVTILSLTDGFDGYVLSLTKDSNFLKGMYSMEWFKSPEDANNARNELLASEIRANS